MKNADGDGNAAVDGYVRSEYLQCSPSNFVQIISKQIKCIVL